MASIEATRYDGRADFVKRLSALFDVIEASYKPPVCDRVGVRYVNRIDDADDLRVLRRLVQPLALAGLQVPHDENVRIRHSFCDTVFTDEEATIRARWGWLPAGAVIDPALSAPERDHWMLDLDVFNESSTVFDSSDLTRQAENFSSKAYRLFRWLVTDEFISHFGGD